MTTPLKIESEVKFTPGPWVIHDYRNWDGGDSISILDGRGWDEKGSWIAAIHGEHVGPTNPDEVLANARLIAAAPEMYEALKAVEEANQIGSWGPAMNKVRAALAKAVKP